jgi:hypothetical protein
VEKKPIFLAVLFVPLTIGAAMASNNKQDQFQARQAQLASQIDGKVDPMSVPLDDSISFLLEDFGIFSMELQDLLTREGWELLRSAAATEPGEVIRDIKAYDKGMDRLCRNLASIDAPAAAGLLQDATDAFHKRRLKRYESTIMRRLGTADLATFESYVTERIAKATSGTGHGSREATVQLATEFPDEYMEAIRQSCQTHLQDRNKAIVRVEQSGAKTDVRRGGYVRRNNE